jgi:hypothetical protein
VWASHRHGLLAGALLASGAMLLGRGVAGRRRNP